MTEKLIINDYEATAVGGGITVDIFWDRQGWYFVDINNHSQVSQEFALLNDCVRYIVLHGYTLRDVRRTRGTVPQPKPKLPERKPSGVE